MSYDRSCLKFDFLVFISRRAVDSNHRATSSTVKTADQNKAQVEAVTSDLLTNLQPRIEGKIDVLVFNPPYVVTPPEEVI